MCAAFHSLYARTTHINQGYQIKIIFAFFPHEVTYFLHNQRSNNKMPTLLIIKKKYYFCLNNENVCFCVSEKTAQMLCCIFVYSLFNTLYLLSSKKLYSIHSGGNHELPLFCLPCYTQNKIDRNREIERQIGSVYILVNNRKNDWLDCQQ